jgi:hypothetical protein
LDRAPVESSNISSVGYDPDKEILEIEFSRGDVYHYFKVPESAYRRFMAAHSKGRYFRDHIDEFYDQRKLQ